MIINFIELSCLLVLDVIFQPYYKKGTAIAGANFSIN